MPSPLPKQLTRRSIEAHIAEQFGGDGSAFLAGVSDAMNQVMRSDLRKARALAGRIELVIPLVTGADRAMAVRIIARYHHLSGNAAKALGLYRRAAEMYARSGDAVATARIGRAMVDALMYLGRYSEANRIGIKTARFFKRRGLEMDWAQTLCNVGNVRHRQDENVPALQAYDQALSVIRSAGNPSALALIQLNRANILTNLHRLKEAESCYIESRALYEESGMTLAAAQAEYSLAYLLFLRGRITEAFSQFEHVLKKFGALGDHRGLAQTRLDMLEIQLEMNQFDAVESEAQSIVRAFRALGMRYEQAKCWYFLAKARTARGDLTGSRKAIAAAHQLVRQEGNRVWDGSLKLLESRLMSFAGRLGDSRGLATGALRSFREAADFRRQAAALLSLADLDIRQGRMPSAQKRLSPFFRAGSQYPTSTMFEAWSLRARIQRWRGQTSQAIASYQRALDAAERMADGLPPDESRIYFVSDKLVVYHELSALLLGQRDYYSALRVLERSRGSWRSAGRRVAPGDQSAIPQTLLDQQEILRARLHRMYGFPTSLGRLAPVDVRSVRLAEDRLWRLVQRGRRFAVRGSPKQAKQNLVEYPHIAAGRTVVIFVSDGEFPGAVMLNGTSITYRRLPVTWEQVQLLIGRLYFFIEKNRIPGVFRGHRESDIIKGTINQLGALSEAVLWPLLADLSGSTEVTFVPLDSLGAIPFHALPLPDGRPLCEFRSVRNTADLTGAIDSRLAQLTPASAGSIFSPVAEGTMEMHAEASHIIDLFPASVHHSGHDASRRNLHSALSDPTDFVHIASHASAALDNPMFSEILLSDGPYYAFDLFDQPIRKQLVTLSACQTGRPGFLHSGLAFGLAEAFIAQGARAVLSSLWTVDDKTTRLFMGDFYRHLSEGDGIHKSWEGAMANMRKTSGNPYNWAPFVLIGMTN